MSTNGRAKPVQVVDEDSGFSSVDAHTGQLAQSYGLTVRQMNNLILAVESKGYPMTPRIGERNRRYWNPQQQFWIKIQHSGTLEQNPNVQLSPDQEQELHFEPEVGESDDRPEQSAQEYSLIRAEHRFIQGRLVAGRNRGANLAIAEGKALIEGYTEVRATVDQVVDEALSQLNFNTIDIPTPRIPESQKAAIVQAVRGCLL